MTTNKFRAPDGWLIQTDGNRLQVTHYGFIVGYVRDSSRGYFGVNTADYGHDRPVGPFPTIFGALGSLGVPTDQIVEAIA